MVQIYKWQAADPMNASVSCLLVDKEFALSPDRVPGLPFIVTCIDVVDRIALVELAA